MQSKNTFKEQLPRIVRLSGKPRPMSAAKTNVIHKKYWKNTKGNNHAQKITPKNS